MLLRQRNMSVSHSVVKPAINVIAGFPLPKGSPEGFSLTFSLNRQTLVMHLTNYCCWREATGR